jgi:tetratricopeptide (TPR) repeat protein
MRSLLPGRALLAIVCCVGCGGDAARPDRVLPAEAPEQVRAEFRAICDGVSAGDNPYYGVAALDKYEAWVAQKIEEPRPRALALGRLGSELLRFGRSDEAAERLDEALAIAAQARLDQELVLDLLRRAALAHLRRGEQSNCVAHHGPASCILPLGADAVHTDRAGSEAALERYLAYLQLDPGDPTVIWLANLASMTLDRFPEAIPVGWRVDPESLSPKVPFARFIERAAERGVHINQPSGGAVLDDFDGDGDLDVVTSSIDPCVPLSLLRNDGQGRFTDGTPGSGLEYQLGGLNLIHADYDNDGDLDLYVLRGGWFGADGKVRNSLLRNDGSGRFEDVTRVLGLAEPAFPTQTAAWGDYDNDGDLDLYVGNESAEDLYAGGLGELDAHPSQLFRNDGPNGFVDVARGSGVANDRLAKGVAWGDYDNDGDLDLYVSNIGRNRLYRNDFPRGFVDLAEPAGVVKPAGRSFATWFFDANNDGWQDLFVADYSATNEQIAAYLLGLDLMDEGRPRLYLNTRDGRFEDASEAMGFVEPMLPMGANFGDFDNDGWLDIYLGTGAPSFESLQPNKMYRNVEGSHFDDVTYAGGFGHLQKGHGVAFGDIDGDGDQDLFEQMGGAYPGDAYPSALYVNPGFENAWITLELEGRRSNRSAIGSRVMVQVRMDTGESREIHRTVGSGGSFGGSSLRLEIGLGRARAVERVEVDWVGGGGREAFTDLELRGSYRLVEDQGPASSRNSHP